MMATRKYYIFQACGGLVLGLITEEILSRVAGGLSTLPLALIVVPLFLIFAYGMFHFIVWTMASEATKNLRRPKERDFFMKVPTREGTKTVRIDRDFRPNGEDPETQKIARRAFWLSFLLALVITFVFTPLWPNGVE